MGKMKDKMVDQIEEWRNKAAKYDKLVHDEIPPMVFIDQKYNHLLKRILEHGYNYEDENRKGVYRKEIIDYQIKHALSFSFPAITTKKLFWKGVCVELLWFLRGDTNIKYLVENGVHIWNKDAYKYYLRKCEYALLTPMSFDTFVQELKGTEPSREHLSTLRLHPYYILGDCGPTYGYQWREAYEIDQISNLIEDLTNNPMSTSHVVSAWNLADIPNMALPPCHYSFQALVTPTEVGKNNLSLKWHQRSVDTFLGLPFNIASYALLTEILAYLTDMKADMLIGDLSNVHLYENHIRAAKLQLSRDVTKCNISQLEFSDNFKTAATIFKDDLDFDTFIHSLSYEDFILKGYESYPAIKAEMIERD